MANEKANMLAKLEDAKRAQTDASTRLSELLAQVDVARADAQATQDAADKAHADAYAEEIAEADRQAKHHEKLHHASHDAHHADVARRRQARIDRGESATPHDSVRVVLIDGNVHQVVAAHGLMIGAHGFNRNRDEPAHGSRYKTACGFTVDAPHDELDHTRFDQLATPDCPACDSALSAGKVTRSDYLTADEHIAHVRAENARRNKRVSA